MGGRKKATMPDSYYPSDDDSEMDQSTDAQGDDSSEGSQTDKGEYETFLAPKSAFSGSLEPGEKHEVEVVHVYEDEVELRCTGDGDEEPKKSAMDDAEESLGNMAS